MKTWQIDVEMRVRKTLVIQAPTEDVASLTARLALAMASQKDHAGLSAFLKWSDGRQAHRPMPVETIIDDDPLIHAVREVPE